MHEHPAQEDPARAGQQPASGAPAPGAHEAEVAMDDLSLVQRFPGPIAYWDHDLRHVVSSRAYQAHYGTDPASIRGAHMRDVLGEHLFAMALPQLERVLAGEHAAVRLPSSDALTGTRWTQETYDPDIVRGKVRGIYVSLVDVTHDVQVERLSDQAQRLAEVGTWTIDPVTRRLTWSEEMYRILGHDPGEFTPDVDAFVASIHPDDVGPVVTAAREAVEAHGDHDVDYRVVRADGEVREVHSRVHAERDEDGHLVMVYGMMQDLTARQVLLRELAATNERLRELNQLGEDVLGVLGHDVRVPLTVLLGQLETTLDAWASLPPDALRERVERAFAAARRLLALCNDILALARSVTGSIEARPEQLEVTEVVREALQDLDRISDVVLEHDGAARALVDPFHLRQMVANLVGNAFRYGEQPVGVTVGHRDGVVVVEVTDRGSGVPPDFVPHLFERFSRAGRDPADHHSASGFGLYVVQRLAEANGATVAYRPHEPHGSCFELSLPVAPR